MKSNTVLFAIMAIVTTAAFARVPPVESMLGIEMGQGIPLVPGQLYSVTFKCDTSTKAEAWNHRMLTDRYVTGLFSVIVASDPEKDWLATPTRLPSNALMIFTPYSMQRGPDGTFLPDYGEVCKPPFKRSMLFVAERRLRLVSAISFVRQSELNAAGNMIKEVG